MKKTTLNIFKDFKCVADKCDHNCCIGWEIDIDGITLNKYKKVQGDFGKKLSKGIDFKHACFKKDSKGRCVFLNENNLCDIIINLGEEALCQVCTDHPRYRNYLADRVEFGIGLSCPIGAKLVLGALNRIEELTVFDDNKQEVLSDFEQEKIVFRNEILSIIQDRNISIKDRYYQVFSHLGLKEEEFFKPDIKNQYLSLERLDLVWEELLQNTVFTGDCFFDEKLDVAYEQLLVYFIYRHIINAVDSVDLYTKTIFCLYSVYVVGCVYNCNKKGGASLEDVARAYSAEIEYSDQNLNTLFDEIDSITIMLDKGE